MAPQKQEALKARWTVMLYMVASKDEQTESAAIRNVRQLQEFGARDDLNLLVQIDRRWPGYPERYRVTQDHAADVCHFDQRERNDSGQPEVLRDFVDWARQLCPAENYMLILWGHAYGLGFGRDNGKALTLPQIAESLSPKYFDGQTPVDVLGVNACAMCYAEAIYELRHAARFLVAPEITMPFAGWPYQTVLNAIVTEPDITANVLCAKIVDCFIDSFEEALESRTVALTAINLAAAEELEKKLAPLSSALVSAIRDAATGKLIAEAFLDTAHADSRPLIDLVDLCERLQQIEAPSASAIKTAASELETFLNSGDSQRLVLKKNGLGDLEGLNGVGIYAPSVTGEAELTRLDLDQPNYDKLALVQKLKTDGGWSGLVYSDLRRLLAPVNTVIAEFINGTGASGIEDRTAVAQLLLSAYRSFIKLGSTVTDTQSELNRILSGQGNGRQDLAAIAPVTSRPVIGWPFLRLAPNSGPGVSRSAASRPGAGMAPGSLDDGDHRLRNSVNQLVSLEAALAEVEKTAKRVMTHSRFGLGDDQSKPDLGDDQSKPDLGDDQSKPDLGTFTASIGARTDIPYSNGTASVVEMFRQVAWALRLVEQAVAKIEDDCASALSDSSDDPLFRQRTIDQLNQSFSGLQEMVVNAKSTMYSVLAHPAYGLGPSIQAGASTATRQQLAAAGGLSSQKLRLL
jgi:hypothetical protein